MARKALNRPTDAELEILSILWQLGPATVREVHEIFGKSRKVTMTTALKFVQIMTEKKLIRKSGGIQRPQKFEPIKKMDDTRKIMVADLLKRAFGGDVNAFRDTLDSLVK